MKFNALAVVALATTAMAGPAPVELARNALANPEAHDVAAAEHHYNVRSIICYWPWPFNKVCVCGVWCPVRFHSHHPDTAIAMTFRVEEANLICCPQKK